MQEQSLQTHLGGLPGDGGPLCGLLPDLPQHPGRRPRGLQQQLAEEPLPDAQVMAGFGEEPLGRRRRRSNVRPLSLPQRVHRPAVQLPARPRRQLLQHAALQHTGPRLRRPEHRRVRHLQIHSGNPAPSPAPTCSPQSGV